MSRNRIKEITVDVDVGHKGHFTAEAAINGAGVIVTDPVVYEVDRKRLHEDNEGFEVSIEVHDRMEHIHYERSCGPDSATLSVIINLHYL